MTAAWPPVVVVAEPDEVSENGKEYDNNREIELVEFVIETQQQEQLPYERPVQPVTPAGRQLVWLGLEGRVKCNLCQKFIRQTNMENHRQAHKELDRAEEDKQDEEVESDDSTPPEH